MSRGRSPGDDNVRKTAFIQSHASSQSLSKGKSKPAYQKYKMKPADVYEEESPASSIGKPQKRKSGVYNQFDDGTMNRKSTLVGQNQNNQIKKFPNANMMDMLYANRNSTQDPYGYAIPEEGNSLNNSRTSNKPSTMQKQRDSIELRDSRTFEGSNLYQGGAVPTFEQDEFS